MDSVHEHSHSKEKKEKECYEEYIYTPSYTVVAL